MTDDELSKLLAEATPETWRIAPNPRLIAAAPTLAAEVLALRAERDALKLCVHHANDCADAAIEAAHAAEAALSEARAALMWARDRIAVDGGMTEKESATTADELLKLLSGAPSVAALYQPAEVWQSPTLAILAASGGDGGKG